MKQQPDAQVESPKTAPKKSKRKGRRLTRWDSLQKEAIAREFANNGNNISKTARVLGRSRNAILRMLKRYDVKDPEKQP